MAKNAASLLTLALSSAAQRAASHLYALVRQGVHSVGSLSTAWKLLKVTVLTNTQCDYLGEGICGILLKYAKKTMKNQTSKYLVNSNTKIVFVI